MLNKGLVEIVKSSDGEGDESQLRLIKPLKRAAAVAPSTMSGEGLDLEESHDDPQGEDKIVYMKNNFNHSQKVLVHCKNIMLLLNDCLRCRRTGL